MQGKISSSRETTIYRNVIRHTKRQEERDNCCLGYNDAKVEPVVRAEHLVTEQFAKSLRVTFPSLLSVILTYDKATGRSLATVLLLVNKNRNNNKFIPKK